MSNDYLYVLSLSLVYLNVQILIYVTELLSRGSASCGKLISTTHLGNQYKSLPLIMSDIDKVPSRSMKTWIASNVPYTLFLPY